MSHPEEPGRRDSTTGVIAALEQLAARTSGSEDPPHARIDAVLESLAAEHLEVIGRIQGRWLDAGHPAGSLPDPSDMAADDTGNVIDVGAMALIATPDEWQVYARIHAALTGPGERPE